MDPKYRMIEEIKNKYRFSYSLVFEAMLKVPREEFVLPECWGLAYEDSALSIGYGQTISQPYTVAFMTHLLGLMGNESVLEIGTGSGYQAAVLSLLAKKVYTIERIKDLGKEAARRLRHLGFTNVHVKIGSGEEGWRQKAPFDAILITAGIGNGVPDELFRELRNGGVLVAPIGEGEDKVMTRFRKSFSGQAKFKKEEFGVFRFVPFVEKAS
mgnify:CR=1 FL=1